MRSYIISIVENSSEKIGALICSVKFRSTEVALYLYRSTICPCMKYCCHIWNNEPSCYLELLDNVQKSIRGTLSPSLAASLEPLAHHWNVARLSLFYRYYFGTCPSELAWVVPVPYSWGTSTHYSDKLDDFSVSILDVTWISMLIVSFLAQLGSGILCIKHAFLWPMI